MAAPRPADDDPVVMARRCWDELQQERLRCGVSLRKLAHEFRQQYPSDAPAHTTLKDWFATRKSLPSKPLFLALVRILGLDERHWDDQWERWHRARQIRPSVDQDVLPSPADSASSGPPPSPWRRLVPRSITAIAAAAVVALALLTVAVSQARSSPARPSDLARPAPPAGSARLSPPTSSATAANLAAHADFHRDSSLFRLYDDRRDGRSAILELKIDGVVAKPLYNSRGMTDATHPAKEVPRPAVAPDASLEFRVCVGEYGDPVPERTCGAWTSDPG